MPLALQAGLWGVLSGSALVLGALLAWIAPIPQRVIAGIMAFGSGVLISALSFELMENAFRKGGFDSTSIGFLSGAAVFTAANILISQRGASHRPAGMPTLGRPARIPEQVSHLGRYSTASQNRSSSGSA